MRIIEGIIFLSLAISAHVSAFWMIPQQQKISSDMAITTKHLKIHSASEEQISLLQAWTKNPDVFVQTHEKLSLTKNSDLEPKFNKMKFQMDSSPSINAPMKTQYTSIYFLNPPTLNYLKPRAVSVKTESPYLHLTLSHGNVPNSQQGTSPKKSSDKNLLKTDQKPFRLDIPTKPSFQEDQSPPNYKSIPPKPLKTSKKKINNQPKREVELTSGKLHAQWGRDIYRKISQNMSYPRYSNDSGIVTLKILIASTGKLLNVEVINSSGSPNLNKAALKAVWRVGTFTKAPKELRNKSYQFQLSLNFKG